MTAPTPDPVFLACEVAVLRALTATAKVIVGSYRGRSQRGFYRGTPPETLYRAITPPPSGDELARLSSMDLWSTLLTVLTPSEGEHRARLCCSACNEYVVALVGAQQPHSRNDLRAYLDQAYAVAVAE